MHHPLPHPDDDSDDANVDGYERRALSSFEENYAKSTAGGSGIIVYGILFESEEMELGHVEKAIEVVMKKHPLLGAQLVEGSHARVDRSTHNKKKNNVCVQMGTHPSKFSAISVLEEKPWPPLPHRDGEEEGLDSWHRGDSHGLLQRALVQELNLPFQDGAMDVGSPNGLAHPHMNPINLFKACFYRWPSSGMSRSAMDKLKGIVLRLHNALFDAASMRRVARDVVKGMASVMNAGPRVSTASARGPDASTSTDASALMTPDAMTPTPTPTEEEEVLVAAKLPLPIEDLLPKARPKSLLKKGMDTASYIIKAKNWRLLPFHTLPNIANNSIRPSFRSDLVSRGLGKQGTMSLLASCKREGIELGVVLATSFLKTAATVKGSKGEKLDEFSFSCVMDCRALLEPKVDAGVLGNYTLALLSNAKIKDDNVEFWELAHQVASSIRRDAQKGKHFSKMPLLNMLFSQVLKRPSMTPSSSCRTMLFTISMDTNEPLTESWDAKETQIVGAIGPLTSVHFVGPCFLVSEALINEVELILSFVYPSPLYSRDQILRFLSTSIEILHQSSKQL